MDGKMGGWIKAVLLSKSKEIKYQHWANPNVESLGWRRVGAGKGRQVSGCLGCPCKYSTAHASTVRYQLMPNVDRKPDEDSEHLLKVGCNWWLPLKDNQKWVAEHLCLTFFSLRFSGLDHGASMGRRQLCQAYATLPCPYSFSLSRIWFSSQLFNKPFRAGTPAFAQLLPLSSSLSSSLLCHGFRVLKILSTKQTAFIK